MAAMLLMDRDEMSILYGEPSIDDSYHISVHLAEGFQRRRLKCENLTDDGRRTPSDGKSSQKSFEQHSLKVFELSCEKNSKVEKEIEIYTVK